MASSDRIQDVLNKYVRDYMRYVHTIKPAVITRVNGSLVDANILTKTKSFPNTQELQASVTDVPLQTITAGWGESSITVPIAVGDLVMILFSDRDYGNLLDYNKKQIQAVVSDKTKAPDADEIDTHEYFPILAIPTWFTEAERIDIPTDRIRIKHKGKTIEITNDSIVLTNGSSKITMSESNISLNATTITLNGIDWNTHTHEGVSTGTAVSGPVTPLPA